jgi:hypothetical protein
MTIDWTFRMGEAAIVFATLLADSGEVARSFRDHVAHDVDFSAMNMIQFWA